MMKNVFYFISNALFVLKIESLKFKIKKKKKKIKTFWSCRKNSSIKKIRLISKFMTSQLG